MVKRVAVRVLVCNQLLSKYYKPFVTEILFIVFRETIVERHESRVLKLRKWFGGIPLAVEIQLHHRFYDILDSLAVLLTARQEARKVPSKL